MPKLFFLMSIDFIVEMKMINVHLNYCHLHKINKTDQSIHNIKNDGGINLYARFT